jgi:hypothetical protein
MTQTIVDYRTMVPSVGAAFRRARPGPESDLVQQFLNEIPVIVPDGCHATIFCEPRLASGFPDLVVVIWNRAATRRWHPRRANLLREDIRLLHYLYLHGRAFVTPDSLTAVFRRGLAASLDRLRAARLIQERNRRYAALPLYQAFAARRIIAIEAKVSEWSSALDQAFRNQWFASESFVLLPRRKATKHLRNIAKSRGLGICCPGDTIVTKTSSLARIRPRSYVSWLFNEWAWRFAESTGEGFA